MRLTLRTLLAYLDDVLEPAQTKLIGQKIQESAVAGKLVSLIRLVVRQRRLKAPSVSGPNVGIDPNVVAQYLDNTLAPEQVVEVERVLLTSDELLAEVASCHQVLALVMGKPTEISEPSRERLYALGPVDKSDQLQVDEPRNHGNDPAVGNNGRTAERVADTPVPKSAVHEVPEYLRQSSWSQRAFPAAIVALLVILCLGLLISDPKFLTAFLQVKKELSKPEREASSQVGDSPATVAVKDDANAPQNQMASTDPVAVTPASVIPPSPVIQGVDPPPPPDANPNPPAEGPADAALASNRQNLPAVASVPPNMAKAGNEPAPILSPAVVQYISNDGVVLRLDEMQNHWFLLPRRSAIAPGEQLVVLEPFEAVLDLDRGGMIATVMGDSAIRLLPPDRAVSVGLDVRRGRMLFRSSRKEASKIPVVAIAVGNDSWKLEFLSVDTVCTIEVLPREPVQFEKSLGQNWYVGVLRVLSGSVKWSAADGQVQQVGSETALEIVPQTAEAGVRPSPVSSAFVPDWTDTLKRKQSPLRRFAALFEKQFELDQPVEMTLLALIKDPNAKIVELTVHGLSLTDSYAGMVQALAEGNYEEGRFAARDGLRLWLAREADRGPVLKGILEQHYPGPEAGAVYQMLWGFKPEDATNRPISLELVNQLRSSHVEIRELAYYWIVHLSGRKWEFRATDVPARRETAIRRIETQVSNAGALVKPNEKDAVPK